MLARLIDWNHIKFLNFVHNFSRISKLWIRLEIFTRKTNKVLNFPIVCFTANTILIFRFFIWFLESFLAYQTEKSQVSSFIAILLERINWWDFEYLQFAELWKFLTHFTCFDVSDPKIRGRNFKTRWQFFHSPSGSELKE